MNSHAGLRRARTGTTRPSAGEKADLLTLAEYRERVTALAERIRGTDDLASIVDMLRKALVETRRLRTREDELTSARRKVAEAERSIESMKCELEQIKAMLHQDPLTGTLNRRGLDEAYRQEASRCDRHGSKLSVALIDLDDFKTLNDTRGHCVGDRALVHMSRLVRGTLRPTDRVGRMGGEEFLLLLPDTGASEAAAVAARIRRALADCPLQEGQDAVAVTFSGGIAQRSPGEALEALVARADAALYAAKRSGKNRCVTAG